MADTAPAAGRPHAARAIFAQEGRSAESLMFLG